MITKPEERIPVFIGPLGSDPIPSCPARFMDNGLKASQKAL